MMSWLEVLESLSTDTLRYAAQRLYNDISPNCRRSTALNALLDVEFHDVLSVWRRSDLLEVAQLLGVYAQLMRKHEVLEAVSAALTRHDAEDEATADATIIAVLGKPRLRELVEKAGLAFRRSDSEDALAEMLASLPYDVLFGVLRREDLAYILDELGLDHRGLKAEQFDRFWSVLYGHGLEANERMVKLLSRVLAHEELLEALERLGDPDYDAASSERELATELTLWPDEMLVQVLYKDQLKRLCGACGLEVTGVKTTLWDRLLHWSRDDSASINAEAPRPSFVDPRTRAVVAVSEPLPSPQPGMRFGGHYVLGKELGQGGFGVVFSVSDQRIPGRNLVAKFSTHEPDVLKQEFARAANISHQNLCAYRELVPFDRYGEVILMDHAGQSMTDRFRRAQARPVDMVKILAQCLHGLDHLHAHDLLHGDVNTGNIMIDGRGVVRLTDFGLTELLVYMGQTVDTKQAQLRGHHRCFAAPEVARTLKGTRRSDIYSLGACTVAMLMGIEAYFKGIQSSRQPHDFIAESTVRPLASLLRRALHPEPDKRYQTAKEFLFHVQNS